jgi:hypothetical protein
VIACPACGLALPQHARFCARCGTALPAGGSRVARVGPAERPVSVGALVILALGTVVAAMFAAAYALIFADPQLSAAGAGGKVNAGQLRAASAVVVAIATVMFLLQVAAILGMARGRDWARIVATLAAAGWALTCIGLPLAAVLLHLIWRRPSPLGRDQALGEQPSHMIPPPP